MRHELNDVIVSMVSQRKNYFVVKLLKKLRDSLQKHQLDFFVYQFGTALLLNSLPRPSRSFTHLQGSSSLKVVGKEEREYCRMPDISSSFSNCENKLFSSPVITLHGKQLKGIDSPRTPQETITMRNGPKRTSGRLSSPSGSPRRTSNSPKISSRLPIRTSQNLFTRFSMKDVRLPLDDSISITNSQSNNNNNKVTPEKLMEELRAEVKKKQRRRQRELDEEISLSIPFIGMEMEELRIGETGSTRPRMSLRNRCPIIVDAPDLIYEDPLEVARQTLQNTRNNTGYRHIKLIYTLERRSAPRISSPEPAFSKKKGIRRHLLSHFEDDEEEKEQQKSEGKLKFDRILTLFEVEEEEEEEENSESAEDSEFRHFVLNLDAKPMKSCLKPAPHLNNDESSSSTPAVQQKPQIVQVKRICYEGEDEDVILSKSADPPDSPTKKRRFNSGNCSAKRLKKPED